MKNKLLHVIASGKFSNGYINYMKHYFAEYNQAYFVRGGRPTDSLINNLVNQDEVYYIENYDTIVNDSKLLEIAKSANKIIVSGAWGISQSMFYDAFYKTGLIRKTYFHFWGADFYVYRDLKRYHINHPRTWLRQQRFYNIFRHCKGLIFLIPYEYEVFQEIIPVRKKNFVAPMADYDPTEKKEYSEDYRGISKDRMSFLLGNAAFDTNQHEEVIRCFCNRFNQQEYKLYCPLSYGDEYYKEHILNLGYQLLGNKFIPLLEYVSLRDYFDFLGTVSIGIFNNNRQQAMGNIHFMIKTGAKVYLRDDTSMYKYFKDLGFIVHSIKELETDSFESITRYDKEESSHNITIYRQFEEDYRKESYLQWKRVFDD